MSSTIWGRSDYHGLQAKWERRFAKGLSFMASYSFSKDLSYNSPDAETDRLTPYAPQGYLRGRSGYHCLHILFANVIWELPFGRGKPFGSDMNPVANAILGGWQISAINSFTSGAPLSIYTPGATLGNGWGTRADQSGTPAYPTRRRNVGSIPRHSPPRLHTLSAAPASACLTGRPARSSTLA